MRHFSSTLHWEITDEAPEAEWISTGGKVRSNLFLGCSSRSCAPTLISSPPLVSSRSLQICFIGDAVHAMMVRPLSSSSSRPTRPSQTDFSLPLAADSASRRLAGDRGRRHDCALPRHGWQHELGRLCRPPSSREAAAAVRRAGASARSRGALSSSLLLELNLSCPLADATVSFALRSNSSSGTLTRRRRSARRRRSYARSRSTCTLTTPSATRSRTSTTMRTRSTRRSASSASGWTRQPRTPSWTERARTRGRTGDDDQVARGRSSNASNDVHNALRERERDQEAQTANKA